MKKDIYGRIKGKPCELCGGEWYPHSHCCDKCIKLFGVIGCSGQSSCQCHKGIGKLTPTVEEATEVLMKENFELNYCPKCMQMTNHLKGKCQKCDKMEWRENIHETIKKLLKWQVIPPIIIDAIDSAYVQGLRENPNKLTAKEIYQNGFKAGKAEMLK